MRRILSVILLVAVLVVVAPAQPAHAACNYGIALAVDNADGSPHTGWVQVWIGSTYEGLWFIHNGAMYSGHRFTGTMPGTSIVVKVGLFDDTDTALAYCQVAPNVYQIVLIDLPY